ncbi:DUF4136 domain-containing protein [Roseateles depolymerans]|uniref:Putative lipoprotein n=1 Tax=Roseateles depolymerans TaxID=76731 RepID=A0A0U3MJS1_9BURK|nr:DUF4136 domain-containing protein [Roseateles depolymerans]ALV08713.1 Putative lipoprotein [Roseateles depolymerans]REG21059.1 uncharacterized protein DUF4136 [Roseateles depolymerans]
MFSSIRRLALASFGAAAVLALTGCAALNTVSAEVQTFGSWPAGRQPGTYAFERMPSQQQNEQAQARLEDAARAALEKVGFTAAPDAKSADVLVTLGARITRTSAAPWDDPLWWRWNGNYFQWRYGPAWRPYYNRWGFAYPMDPMMERRYDREVALLLRDRKTNEPLYEARASNDGLTEGDSRLLAALFESSMADFPQTRPEPHSVSVTLPPAP